MEYKLICIDMDGTLLSDIKEISDRNKEAIKKAYDKGVKIAVCTGRIFTSANYFADLLEIKTPVIASNGAYIREKDRDKVIYQQVLGYDNCKDMLDVFRKHNIYPHYYSTDTIFTEKIIHSSSFYAEVNKTLPKDRKINIVVVEDWDEIFHKYEEEIFKGVGIHEDENIIANARQELEEIGTFEVVSSFVKNFEAMNKGVSKGRAVEILADYYGLSSEEVICIGDGENDLSMIKYAGLGVAMKNANDMVKEHADYITDFNYNHGVAKVIEKFILK